MSVVSSTSSSQHPFLRNLSVFSLPNDLLEALSVRSIQAAEREPEQRQQRRPEAETAPTDGRLACQTCPGAIFESIDEQRVHFRSDWHRYNTKLKVEALTGKSKGEVVGLEQFEGLVEGECLHQLVDRRYIVPIWVNLLVWLVGIIGESINGRNRQSISTAQEANHFARCRQCG